MKINCIISNILKTVFICMLCQQFSLLYVCAAEPETQTVRVAYPIQEGLTDVDESGNYSGYTYEFLEEVAQYTGWNYEFVQVSGSQDEQLSTLMKMVKEGDVDLMGAMLYSEPLGELFYYSGYSYGTVETVLQILSDGPQHIVIDSQKEQTFRIAVIKGASKRVEELEEYCRINLIEPVLVECDSDEEQLEALKDGRADLLLSTNMYYLKGVRTIARFSPKPFYFVTSKNNDSGLIAQLNEAIDSIFQTDPYFQTTLFEKYFASVSSEVSFSKEEISFIKNAGVLKAGVYVDQPPFQYKDRESGELAGIGVDILSYFSEKTGLEFTMVEAASMEQLYQMMRDGEIDLIASMPYTYSIAGDQGLVMTRPYISCQYSLLMNENMSEDGVAGKKLAMPKTSAYKGYFVGDVTWYDSVSDCVRAVNSGKADYTYVDTYTGQYYMYLPEFAKLKMIPLAYEPREFCFGLPKKNNNTLLKLLNKMILSMPVEDLQGIIYSDTVRKQQFSPAYVIRRYPVQTILVIASVFLIILVLLLIILVQRLRTNKAISFELQKHLRLYQISNDYLFEYDYHTGKLLYSVSADGDSNRTKSMSLEVDGNTEGHKFLEILRMAQDSVHELYVQCMDGKWHWLRVTMETIRDENDMPVCAVGKINIIDEEKTEKEALENKAQRDSLTHLYNNENCRRLIDIKLSEMREGERGALLLLDVDHFKNINDTYGHMNGDYALKEVASLLQGAFSEEDIVGRPGGDEFLVYVICATDRKDLELRCEALCKSVREIEIDRKRPLTISVGVAFARAGQSYEEIYKAADETLYEVKECGRNRFLIAGDR